MPASNAKSPSAGTAIRSVGFLLVPGFALMAYSAAVEPLRAANHLAGRRLYDWRHISIDGEPAKASSGAAIMPDLELSSVTDLPDLVLVCAGGNPATFTDRAVLAWLRRIARGATIVGGVSGGPFILAKAGLLDGHRCTLHWEHAPAFQEAFPRARLTRSLFEIDGRRITCSGGIAALDMMIALIGRDHGHELAAAVSDWLLHTQMREGMWPHRMSTRLRLGIADQNILTVIEAMESNLETPVGREELARLAGLSVRQLERRFRQHLGRGIHRHYLNVRLDQASRLLRETSLQVIDVGIATGFASASQFCRAYRERFGRTPRSIRSPG